MTRDLSTLQADADLHAVMTLVKKWRDKSDNEELIQFEEMMLRLAVYIWQLQNERKTFDNVIDELRSEKHRMIKRARRVEEELTQLKSNKNENIKNFKN